MNRLDKISEEIFKKYNILEENVVFSIKSDLSKVGNYEENYIIVTYDSLIIVDKNTQNTIEYEIEHIENIKIENLISNSLLSAKIEEKHILLCRFTNTQSKKFDLFVKLFNKIKAKEKLKEEDFKLEEEEKFCPKCGTLYTNPKRKICTKCMDKRAIFLRVLEYAKPYKIQMTFMLVLIGMSTFFNILIPYVTGKILFDKVLNNKENFAHEVVVIILILFVLKLLCEITSILYSRISAKLIPNMIYDIKLEIFKSIQNLSMKFYNNKQTGGLMATVNNDAETLQNFLVDGVIYFISNGLTIIVIFIVLLMINVKLAIMVLLPIPIIAYMIRKITTKFKILYTKSFRKRKYLNIILNDVLTGIRVVKAFGKENEEIKKFTKSNENYAESLLNTNVLLSKIFPLINFVFECTSLIIWLYGSFLLTKGQITFGTIISFTGYLGMIYRPISFFSMQFIDWWTKAMNAAHRVFSIIDERKDIEDKKDAISIDIKGDIEFKNVDFSYEANKLSLKNINLKVKSGEMIGLVGTSGAGKSTLINILSRLYDVERGEVSIDKVNIKDIKIEDLRKQIGIVPQEAHIFSASIYENIAYAKKSANMEEVVKAAKYANAHEFIMKLPNGYDTLIGGGGYNLSGGQAQRISIARVIVQNPKILILDEATSAVDTETERMIQYSIEHLVKGKTTFAIAHRLSTLKKADRLIVLDKGEIIEKGTHTELENKKGKYYEFLKIQMEALKLKKDVIEYEGNE